MLLLLCLLSPLIALGQETDTTRQELELEKKKRSLNLERQLDRSTSGGIMTEMGTYNVPNETQYYKQPFMGQHYLDMAVEAYRKELEDRIGQNWYWQFLRAVSPYIRLQLAPLNVPELEYVDRDNPLWRSYNNDEKRQ